MMAILKANAYGHDIYEISKALSSYGVNAYAVATVDEGIEVRNYGIDGTILVLGYTCPTRASDLNKYSLSQCVFDKNYASALNAQNVNVSVHIALDTGMHRLGIQYDDIVSIKEIFNMKNLNVDAIFSHLCVSDSSSEDDVTYTKQQVCKFNAGISLIESEGLKIRSKHLQSSYGLLNYPDIKYDYARIGISLYGVDSSSDIIKKTNINLKPVLSLKSKVIQLRELGCGEPVSYGRKFITERQSKIAVLPFGYADGYPRNLSCGIGRVLIRGQYAPIVGRICMDQMMIDVTDVDDVQVDDVVTLIGCDGENVITAEEVAEKAGTITNELLSCLGSRITVITK
jgi:serine/alanine racemase